MLHPFLQRLRDLLDISRGRELAPTHVRRLERPCDRLSGELTLVERLSAGDCILCVAGDVIPCHGVVVDGFAAVRQRRFEPAPNDSGRAVLRGGSSVRPGMTVMANFLIVRVERSESA